MIWPPPLPVRMPDSEDYTSLGQDADASTWVPMVVGLLIFFALLLVATLLGKI
jgi:hypothetical protein